MQAFDNHCRKLFGLFFGFLLGAWIGLIFWGWVVLFLVFWFFGLIWVFCLDGFGFWGWIVFWDWLVLGFLVFCLIGWVLDWLG